MTRLRDPRLAALLLTLAAVLGLVLANAPSGPAFLGLVHAPLGVWTIGEWVEDGLLALFFLVAAAELREELVHGSLRSPARAAVPILAALGGVAVPVAIYAAMNAGSADTLAGWAIPSATDVAFALGALALLGRGLPTRVRAFLLALAIVDDLIGILIIALRFGADWHRAPLLIAVVLGLVLPHRAGHAMRRVLEPVVNLLVLPCFALVACAVAIPEADALGGAFWGVAIALPLGKLLGIAGAGWLAGRLLVRDAAHRLPLAELTLLGALGGIGFTVALLLARLSFAGASGIADAAVLGVLVGSLASIVIAAAAALALRLRRVRSRA